MAKYECNTMAELYETKFKKIYSDKVLNNMSLEEKKQYYEDLKCYLKTLDYDKDAVEESEKNFIKAGKVIMPIFDFLFRPQAINKQIEEKNKEIGTIYVCNHLNSIDQFAVISALGKDRPLHALASSTLLNLKRSLLYKKVGSIFLDLTNIKSMFQGLEEAEKLLLDGKDVLIFPEGTRNATDNLILKFLPGAIMASRDTGAPIVPLAVNENYKLFGNTLYVRRGEKFVDDLSDDTVEASRKLQEQVVSLIWENMELEKEVNYKITREEIIKQQEKKRLCLEKQRQKINKKA